MKTVIKSIVAMILAAGATAPALATIMSYSNTATDQIGTMGSFASDSTTYGEVFKAPGGRLVDWTFYLSDGRQGNGRFAIAGWDGGKATGPALYEQAFSYAPGMGVVPTTFSGINLDLVSGNSYVAYLTVGGVTDAYSSVNTNISSGDGGLGGYFAVLNTRADPLTLDEFWPAWIDSSMQFKAGFTPLAAMPEPGSLALLAIGCVGLAALRARKG